MSYDPELNKLKGDLVRGYKQLQTFSDNLNQIIPQFKDPQHQAQLRALQADAYGNTAAIRHTVIEGFDMDYNNYLKPYSGPPKNWGGAVKTNVQKSIKANAYYSQSYGNYNY
eukprot:385155_1